MRLQAAVLRVKAPRLAAWSEARRRNAARYRESVPARPASTAASILPVEGPGQHHIYNQFVVRVPHRDQIKASLARRQRGHGRVLSRALSPSGVLRLARLPARARFLHAEAAARETLALPIYGELTDAQLSYVVTSMAAALDEAGA